MNKTSETSTPTPQLSPEENTQDCAPSQTPANEVLTAQVPATLHQSTVSTWLPIVFTFFSLVIASGALLYSKEQTDAAKESLVAAIEQLRLARVAQTTAEKNYSIAKEQLELQRAEIEDDNKFPVVYDASFLDALRRPLSNMQMIQVVFVNRTKRAQSYRVSVEADGVGVYFEKVTPKKLFSHIYLDNNPVVVPPDGEYRQYFVVWHSTKPAPRAALRLHINGRPYIDTQYEYNQQLAAYVPVNG